MEQMLVFFYAESPVHAGADSSTGVIDLPIQREAATSYPVIWGQSLKGALREAATDAGWGPDVAVVFGPAVEDAGGSAAIGKICVGDAHLVAFPAATLQHTFAWVTSELALGRLSRLLLRTGHTPPIVPRVGDGALAVASSSWSQQEVFGPTVLGVRKETNGALGKWAKLLAARAVTEQGAFRVFADKLTQDLVCVDQTAMELLVKEGTEVQARVQLNKDKTVQNGPFYSEYLPTETIMAATVTLTGAGEQAAGHRAKLGALIGGENSLLQIGGDETIGKGLVWVRTWEAGA